MFLNVVLKEDKDEIRKEFLIKKIKLIFVKSNDMLIKEDSKKSLNYEYNIGMDFTIEKIKFDDLFYREKIK